MAYQRQAEKEILRSFPSARIGQWFVFFDAFGRGHCQPDAFVETPSGIILFEIKLTQTERAFLQMAQLYVPVLEHVYKKPVACVQMCKGLRYEPEVDFNLHQPLANPTSTWHYLGK